MNQNNSNHIPIDDEIKRIAEEVLDEVKTHQLVTIRSAEDDEAPLTGVRYQRGDSISMMEKMELLEIVEVDENLVYKNRHSGDTTLFKYPIYQVKIHVIQINKFLQNPDVRLFLKDPNQPLIYSPDDIVIKKEKLSIIKKTANTVYLYYEGMEPSKTVSKKSPWMKVLMDYMKHTRLTRTELVTRWNTAERGKYGSQKKTRQGEEYFSKINQAVKNGIKRASKDIADMVEIEPGKRYYKKSFTLEIK